MSLLARLSASNEGGPVRPKSASRASPYARPSRPPKGDPDAQWSHDLYEDPDKPSLSSRLTSSAAVPRKPDSLLAQRALREATAAGGISIKGASTGANGNVVQVEGLVKGTSAADVEAIFRRCGPIVSSELATNKSSDNVTVRLTFKQVAHAAAAVSKFDKQPADGRVLHVSIVGVQSVGLSGRLGGVDVVNENGSVDVLMGGNNDGGSKMRSDSIMHSDPRAMVLVVPPGTNTKVHNQRNNFRAEGQRGQRGGRRGGRGRHGGGGGGVSGMDID
ncbi:hypothetical protein PAXRUDRAFT_825112 [Paxillus rubicundulus Ve08.2h10]|uniref:RRM domain-containing protein n=1 Tax=Paxillus rubicundulus Ve08.2h10 TaxID=930991 RepID=A0A0D0DGV1_9AGAM|nr:hypothetical protein PAXRUDRAFT_825112 [Paxillus rubicundulus Ve08.2h10]